MDNVQKWIGYRFREPSLLEEALTHPSYEGGRGNERLEFLGDSVIEVVVSHLLYERFPERDEGALSKMRASLVNEGTLAEIARQGNLGESIRMGKGEERSGGRGRASILASALEALVAAVYLDGGYEEVQRVIQRLFLPLVLKEWEDRDYKSQLQEYTQGHLHITPSYHLISQQGPDHKRRFEVEVRVAGEVWGRGVGRSKKEAEQRAAEEAIRRIHEG